MDSPLASKDTFKKRMAICRKCPHLFKATNTCKKCGCFMSLKCRLANVVCPVDKWGKEDA